MDSRRRVRHRRTFQHCLNWKAESAWNDGERDETDRPQDRDGERLVRGGEIVALSSAQFSSSIGRKGSKSSEGGEPVLG